MALDAWSGTVGAIGAAFLAAIGGLVLKNRELRQQRENATTATSGEVTKTIETAFDKSEQRNEKLSEKYERVLDRVAALDIKVALQDQRIIAQDEKISHLEAVVKGKDDDLRAALDEKRLAIERAIKAEGECEIYRVGMESVTMMLEASTGKKIDEAFLVIAREKMDKATVLARNNRGGKDGPEV